VAVKNPGPAADDDSRYYRAENRHHVKVSLLRWRIVRHDGALLGGYSRREDAERVLAVICRDGALRGHAYIVAPKGAP